MSQSRPLMLGLYYPSDSLLHRLDARAKLLPLAFLMILSLFSDSIVFSLLMLTFLAGALLFSRLPISMIVGSLKPLIWLIGLTSIFHLLFSGRESEALFELFGLTIRSGAVDAAVFYSLRLTLFVALALVVTLTCDPSDLAAAAGQLLRPLERLRFPVYEMTVIIFMAMRLIPVLLEEYQTIKNAQMMRGVDFSGSWAGRVRKSVCVILPLFLAAVERAETLALAMAARGGRGWTGFKRKSTTPRPTFYSRSRFGLAEMSFTAAATGLIMAAFWSTS